ncbi:hypothetical protein GBAR_LOCUS26836 [Geodia barretti]|uniref:Uncharacterized protein n=1 Tax=Geodia barretti TaxID=519541 RepID=A0AA35XEP9_GEOBA|nr:hypothetical protein GBAR_LOCUS26836 [Geodia barretti]
MATYECRVTLTPLLGPASPVSSSASIFLNISTRSSFEDVITITTMEITSASVVLPTNTRKSSAKTALPTMNMKSGQPASCQSESNESASVVGGILSLVIILIIGVSILGFAILILKIRTLKLMLEKQGVREGGEVESKSVPTATNAAYGGCPLTRVPVEMWPCMR